MAAPGKWGNPDVPNDGWIFEEVIDLSPDDGTPFEEYCRICQMCESKAIRFQHRLSHAQWPHCINAGCVCAGKMENNGAAAKRREAVAYNRMLRKRRWPTLQAWQQSPNGNWHISHHGVHVLVVKVKSSKWRIRIKCEQLGGQKWGNKRFDTLRQAKQVSFDAFEYARDKLGWGS